MLCWRLVKLIMTCLDKNIADTLDTFWLFSTKCPHNQFCFWFESPFVYHTRLWLLTFSFFTLPLLFLLQQTFSLKYLLDIFYPIIFLHFSLTMFSRSFWTHLEGKYAIDNSFFPDRWDFQSPTLLEQNSFLTEDFLVWLRWIKKKQ